MDKYINYKLTEKEKKLIELLRSIQYGEFMVYIQNGNPERVERIKESVKL